jgi:heavy metal sensor kinase
MNHRSLAFRLAVWYALLLSATFALVGAGMCYGLEQYLRSSLRDSLRRRSVQVQQILQQAPAGVSDRAIAEAIDTRVAPDFNNRFVRVTRAPATLVYRSGAPADRSFDPAVAPSQTDPWPSKTMVHPVATVSGQLMISLTPIDTASGRYLIELGTALGPVEALQHRLLSLLAVMLPVLVACAAGGGYLLVQRALQPVERMSQTAERISVQDLEARLPVAATGDALQRLSISFNHMLSRLRDSVFSSRRFLADASHELRTPLTIIKGELQEVLAHEAGHSELGERIGSVLEEVARLEHLVSGLLVLSRLDAGEARSEWRDVNLGELAASTVEHMRLVAEDRGVQLQASELALAPVTLRGDARRLKQVIVNLLDNAIKFTPRGGVVGVSTQQHEGFGLLEVFDRGIGIPPDSLPHVFDRFYRVDAARSREDGGAGLGLSIVRSICSAHGAEIEVDSTPGSGSRFRVKFPLPPQAALPGPGAADQSPIPPRGN